MEWFHFPVRLKIFPQKKTIWFGHFFEKGIAVLLMPIHNEV